MASRLLRKAGTWFAATPVVGHTRKWHGAQSTSAVRTVVIRAAVPRENDEDVVRCAKCNIPVNPGMTHRAKVYTGDLTVVIDRAKLVAVTPEVQYEDYQSKIKRPKFTTGHVCDTCCTDYSIVVIEHRDGSRESFPRVATLPRPVMAVRDQTEGYRSNKGFSSRIKSRGNTGSRHKMDNYFIE